MAKGLSSDPEKLARLAQQRAAVGGNTTVSTTLQNIAKQSTAPAVKPSQASLQSTPKGGITVSSTKNGSNIVPMDSVVNQANSQMDQLRNMVNQQLVQKPVQMSNQFVQDNSDFIKQMFEQQKNAAIAALKQKIAQSTGNFQRTIAQAPQQFQQLKNQSEVDRMRNLETARESLANAGDRGGVGRQDLLSVDTAGANRLNSINQQQQNVIDEARRSINELEASGNMEEAQIVANNAAERLRALIAEQNRVDELNYARGRDAVGDQRYADETRYSRGRDAIGDQRYNQQYKDSRNDLTYDRNYQSIRDAIGDTRYNQEYKDSQAQRNFSNNMQQNQFNFQKQQAAIDNAYRQKQAEIDNAFRTRQITEQERQNALDNAFREKQLSQNNLESQNKTTVLAAITKDLDTLTPDEAYEELLNNPGDYIGDIGATEYKRLLGIYESRR